MSVLLAVFVGIAFAEVLLVWLLLVSVVWSRHVRPLLGGTGGGATPPIVLQDLDLARVVWFLGGRPAQVLEAALAAGFDSAAYGDAAVPLADALRDQRGLGRLTLSWALCSVLSAHPEKAAQLMEDAEPRVRRAALRAVKATADANPASEAVAWAVSVCDSALRDPDSSVRALACSVLAGLRDEGAGAKLASLLHDPDETVQEAAAGALGETQSPQAALALVTRLLTAGPALSREIHRSLARCPAAAPEEIFEWLARGDAARKLVAVRGLGLLGGGGIRGIAILAGLLDHPSPTLRTEAARAMALAFERGAVPVTPDLLDRLAARLRSESLPEALGAVARAVARSGDPRAAPSLLARIATCGHEARERLLEALSLLALLKHD